METRSPPIIAYDTAGNVRVEFRVVSQFLLNGRCRSTWARSKTALREYHAKSLPLMQGAAKKAG